MSYDMCVVSDLWNVSGHQNSYHNICLTSKIHIRRCNTLIKQIKHNLLGMCGNIVNLR